MTRTEEIISVGHLHAMYFRLFLLAKSELHEFNFSCSKPLYQLCKYQDCKWCIPRRGTQTFSRRSFLFTYLTFSRYTWKCHFVYYNNKSMAIPGPIFVKLINALQIFVQIPILNLTQIDNKCETWVRNSFTPIREV